MRRVILGLGGLLVVAGCSVLEPGDADNYVLTRVNGVAVPAMIVDETLPDGRVHRVEVSRAELAFFSRGTFRASIATRRQWSTVPADTLLPLDRTGAFVMLGDTAVQVRFKEAGAWTRVVYRVLEGGDLLRAVEVIAGKTLVYDYRRQ